MDTNEDKYFFRVKHDWPVMSLKVSRKFYLDEGFSNPPRKIWKSKSCWLEKEGSGGASVCTRSRSIQHLAVTRRVVGNAGQLETGRGCRFKGKRGKRERKRREEERGRENGEREDESPRFIWPRLDVLGKQKDLYSQWLYDKPMLIAQDSLVPFSSSSFLFYNFFPFILTSYLTFLNILSRYDEKSIMAARTRGRWLDKNTALKAMGARRWSTTDSSQSMSLMCVYVLFSPSLLNNDPNLLIDFDDHYIVGFDLITLIFFLYLSSFHFDSRS